MGLIKVSKIKIELKADKEFGIDFNAERYLYGRIENLDKDQLIKDQLIKDNIVLEKIYSKFEESD